MKNVRKTVTKVKNFKWSQRKSGMTRMIAIFRHIANINPISKHLKENVQVQKHVRGQNDGQTDIRTERWRNNRQTMFHED